MRSRVRENALIKVRAFTSAATLIKNFPQNQTVRWRGHSSDAPIFARQNFRDIIRRNLPLPDLNECSNDSPAHFVEKTVAFDNYREQLAVLLDVTTS